MNNQNVLDTYSDHDYSQDFGAIEKYYADNADKDNDLRRNELVANKLPWWEDNKRALPNF